MCDGRRQGAIRYLESVLDDRLGPVGLEEEPPRARPRHRPPGLGAGRRGEKGAGPARRPRLRVGVERGGVVGARGRRHRSAGPRARGHVDGGGGGLLGAARRAASAIPHGLVLRLGRRRRGVGVDGGGDGGGVLSVGPHARAGVTFLSWESRVRGEGGGGSGRRGTLDLEEAAASWPSAPMRTGEREGREGETKYYRRWRREGG
jgi:hypothetical protein